MIFFVRNHIYIVHKKKHFNKKLVLIMNVKDWASLVHSWMYAYSLTLISFIRWNIFIVKHIPTLKRLLASLRFPPSLSKSFIFNMNKYNSRISGKSIRIKMLCNFCLMLFYLCTWMYIHQVHFLYVQCMHAFACRIGTWKINGRHVI